MSLTAYELGPVIGRGGMGTVTLAHVRAGPEAGRTVVVKRLRTELARDRAAVGRFLREARLAACLRHPAVVAVLEAGLDGDGPFLVLEHVDGRDLAHLLAACRARRVQLPIDFALFIAHVVAEALGAAHGGVGPDGRSLGIVHCDVSPGNVLLSREGEVKLADFGVARAVGEGGGAAPLGKARFLAPERLRREPVGPPADVFAAGALLFELLTLAPAFPGEDAGAVVREVLSAERRLPSALRPEVPPAVDAVVLRALAPDPASRPRDGRALAEALAPLYDPAVGTPLAVAAVVRGLFG